MSGMDKKLNNKSPEICGFTVLFAAELALKIGAIFGFLAVLALVLMHWACVLGATLIAVVALATAVVLLTIPANPLSGKVVKTKGEPLLPPKCRRVESGRRLSHPAPQILKPPASKNTNYLSC